MHEETVHTDTQTVPASAAEREEERKLIRRLQMMMNMVMQVIAQDGTLTVDDASRMIADSREAALAMFPGKDLETAFSTAYGRTVPAAVSMKRSRVTR